MLISKGLSKWGVRGGLMSWCCISCLLLIGLESLWVDVGSTNVQWSILGTKKLSLYLFQLGWFICYSGIVPEGYGIFALRSGASGIGYWKANWLKNTGGCCCVGGKILMSLSYKFIFGGLYIRTSWGIGGIGSVRLLSSSFPWAKQQRLPKLHIPLISKFLHGCVL